MPPASPDKLKLVHELQPAIRDAAFTVMGAQVAADIISPIVQSARTKVLNSRTWMTEGKHGEAPSRLERHAHNFLLSDADHKEYHQELRAAYRAAGLESKCPEADINNRTINAEADLLNAITPITGLTSDDILGHLSQWRELVDLTVALASRSASTKAHATRYAHDILNTIRNTSAGANA